MAGLPASRVRNLSRLYPAREASPGDSSWERRRSERDRIGQALIADLRRSHAIARESLSPGTTAKDFGIGHVAGKPSHLSDLRGKVVVLNFWASGAPPASRKPLP